LRTAIPSPPAGNAGPNLDRLVIQFYTSPHEFVAPVGRRAFDAARAVVQKAAE
jgi:hypothetical protein